MWVALCFLEPDGWFPWVGKFTGRTKSPLHFTAECNNKSALLKSCSTWDRDVFLHTFVLWLQEYLGLELQPI